MHLFLGLDIPSEARKAIISSIASLQEQYAVFQWIQPDDYRVNIGDLGEVPADKIGVVRDHIEMLLFDIAPTHLYFFEFHLFVMKQMELRLIFRDNKTVKEVSDRIAVFRDPHLQKKQRFVPQILLARYRVAAKQQNTHLRNKIARLSCDLTVPVQQIILYQSEKNMTDKATEVASFQLSAVEE